MSRRIIPAFLFSLTLSMACDCFAGIQDWFTRNRDWLKRFEHIAELQEVTGQINALTDRILQEKRILINQAIEHNEEIKKEIKNIYEKINLINKQYIDLQEIEKTIPEISAKINSSIEKLRKIDPYYTRGSIFSTPLQLIIPSIKNFLSEAYNTISNNNTKDLSTNPELKHKIARLKERIEKLSQHHKSLMQYFNEISDVKTHHMNIPQLEARIQYLKEGIIVIEDLLKQKIVDQHSPQASRLTSRAIILIKDAKCDYIKGFNDLNDKNFLEYRKKFFAKIDKNKIHKCNLNSISSRQQIVSCYVSLY